MKSPETNASYPVYLYSRKTTVNKLKGQAAVFLSSFKTGCKPGQLSKLTRPFFVISVSATKIKPIRAPTRTKENTHWVLSCLGKTETGGSPKESQIPAYLHIQCLAGVKFCRNLNGEAFFSSEAQALCILAGQILEGHDAHSHQIASMNPLETLANDRLDSLNTKEQVPQV